MQTLQAVTPQIPINTPTPISVLWTNGGVPQNGFPVTFTATRGTITGSPATTNASGIATASITASSTGATILSASGSGGTPAAIDNVVFYTTTASTINTQALPTTVAVNFGSSTSNQSQIVALVRDSGQNLVQNATVAFNIVADPSGGSLSAASATTDITGTAAVNYIAGTAQTLQNGVQISATVTAVDGVATTAPQPTTTVNLTVAAQNLFVTLGTDNLITPNPGTYTKKYYALVTDSAGNAAPDNTLVTFSIRPTATGGGFEKGYWVWDSVSTPAQWDRVGVTITKCSSEDPQDTGVYSLALDTNGNNALDPDGVATVNKTATTTGGIATATITYPQDHATWVWLVLEATAGTVGNSPPTTVTFKLPALATEFLSQSPTPAWATSPYGAGIIPNNVCTNTK